MQTDCSPTSNTGSRLAAAPPGAHNGSMSPPSASPPSGNPARLLFGALVCVLAGALVILALHALWLHSRLTEMESSRSNPRGAAAPDMERIAALEARIRSLERSTPAAAVSAEAKPTPKGSPDSPPTPAPTLAYGPLLDRMQLIESAVLRGLGYSFDAPPEPAVVDALLQRPFIPPKARAVQTAPYSPEQLLGPPDSQAGSSSPSAWCSLEPDSGFEWIEAHFEARDTPRAILVRETSAPGAVVQIEAQDGAGQYKVIWAGEPNPLRRPGDFVVQLSQDAFPTRALRITLDSAAIPGWNEIDAVGLITASGIHWAASASASSVWGGGQVEVFATPSE